MRGTSLLRSSLGPDSRGDSRVAAAGPRSGHPPRGKSGAWRADSCACRPGDARAAFGVGADRHLRLLLNLRVRHLDEQPLAVSAAPSPRGLARTAGTPHRRPARFDLPADRSFVVADAGRVDARHRRSRSETVRAGHHDSLHRHGRDPDHARLRDGLPARGMGQRAAAGGAAGTGAITRRAHRAVA